MSSRSFTVSQSSTSLSAFSRISSSSARVTFVLPPVDPVAEEHVVPDGQGQGIRSLEDHPHFLAELDRLHRRVIDVLPQNPDAPGGPHVPQTLDDTVHGPEEGGLYRTRRVR